LGWLCVGFEFQIEVCVGMQEYVIYADGPWGLPLDTVLLPSHLANLGYSPHMIGKWHLGHHKSSYTPTQRNVIKILRYNCLFWKLLNVKL